jgi:hypothetical protein
MSLAAFMIGVRSHAAWTMDAAGSREVVTILHVRAARRRGPNEIGPE